MMLNNVQANQVWDIMVKDAEADPGYDARLRFVHHATGPSGSLEYRFQGALGFGGKFLYPEMRVSCYMQDENSTRVKIIARVNQKLEDLAESWEGEKVKPGGSGIDLIAHKRKRQIDVHGHTPEHDAEIHEVWDIVQAAGYYLLGSNRIACPWGAEWARRESKSLEPTIEDLVNAGALIASAIDLMKIKGQSE